MAFLKTFIVFTAHSQSYPLNLILGLDFFPISIRLKADLPHLLIIIFKTSYFSLKVWWFPLGRVLLGHHISQIFILHLLPHLILFPTLIMVYSLKIIFRFFSPLWRTISYIFSIFPWLSKGYKFILYINMWIIFHSNESCWSLNKNGVFFSFNSLPCRLWGSFYIVNPILTHLFCGQKITLKCLPFITTTVLCSHTIMMAK